MASESDHYTKKLTIHVIKSQNYLVSQLFIQIFYLAAATTACRAYNSSEDSFVRVAPKMITNYLILL